MMGYILASINFMAAMGLGFKFKTLGVLTVSISLISQSLIAFDFLRHYSKKEETNAIQTIFISTNNTIVLEISLNILEEK